ncbi:DNA-binding transcriptional MerR regulator [Kibdelosporangium banguiense]|uniref:DNA-binding transcriptional MerR regulator n=1 Tax=Kibdelosporangium banguiense TaxID=1365924 RepID=A0ABS4TEA9_9PSEU|nr:MerR family transcriptional regulator [Kibdelosporangium banguiense]MBP2322757.1 DNA-binding transcriptional MerR regulator [Kibdelosporangium banguiense]
MRMAELSRRTGVPVPTIKYYLREGLLLPGERTSPNQAFYDASHVRRLKMIRALADVGGLPIAKVRDVLDTVDSPEEPFEVLGTVQKSIEPPSIEGEGEHWDAARKHVAEVLADRGWPRDLDCPPAKTLIAALASVYELGRDDLAGLVERYAEAAEQVAVIDVATVTEARSLEDVIEGVVIGTVLGEKMFGALRRLAHQYATAKALGIDPDSGERE